MNKILNEKEAVIKAEEIKEKGEKIVLVGGCFDILHIGHIRFLEKAKEKGILFVLLESDRAIKKLKGNDRPINKEKERARILSSLSLVNFVILLKGIKNNNDYAKIVSCLKPDFIAITKGDRNKALKEKQAEKVNAQILEIDKVKNESSSKFAKFLKD